VVALIVVVATLQLKIAFVAPVFIVVVALVFIIVTFSCLQDPPLFVIVVS